MKFKILSVSFDLCSMNYGEIGYTLQFDAYRIRSSYRNHSLQAAARVLAWGVLACAARRAAGRTGDIPARWGTVAWDTVGGGTVA